MLQWLAFKDITFLLRRQAAMRRLDTAPHLPAASLKDSALAKSALKVPVHLKKGPRFDPSCDLPTRSQCRSSAGTLANSAESKAGNNCKDTKTQFC